MRVFVAMFEKVFTKGTAMKFRNFEDRLDHNTVLRMKGLGADDSKRFKSKSSGRCTVHILNTGGIVVNYGNRYNVIAKSHKALSKDLDLLKVEKDERELKVVTI